MHANDSSSKQIRLVLINNDNNIEIGRTKFVTFECRSKIVSIQ